jgi:hypothetical protein
MRFKTADSFWQDYRGLPKGIKEKARRIHKQFVADPRHPSIKTHKIRGTSNPVIFEGYIDKGYRFTFHYEEDCIVFRRCGPHSIIDEEAEQG